MRKRNPYRANTGLSYYNIIITDDGYNDGNLKREYYYNSLNDRTHFIPIVYWCRHKANTRKNEKSEIENAELRSL